MRAIAMARRWAQTLASGEIGSLAELARQERISAVYAGQLLPLAFLAPDLIEAILDGRQPAALTLAALIERPLPLSWRAQRAFFSQFA